MPDRQGVATYKRNKLIRLLQQIQLLQSHSNFIWECTNWCSTSKFLFQLAESSCPFFRRTPMSEAAAKLAIGWANITSLLGPRWFMADFHLSWHIGVYSLPSRPKMIYGRFLHFLACRTRGKQITEAVSPWLAQEFEQNESLWLWAGMVYISDALENCAFFA